MIIYITCYNNMLLIVTIEFTIEIDTIFTFKCPIIWDFLITIFNDTKWCYDVISSVLIEFICKQS